MTEKERPQDYAVVWEVAGLRGALFNFYVVQGKPKQIHKRSNKVEGRYLGIQVRKQLITGSSSFTNWGADERAMEEG